jgi:hypothetical protein
LSDYNWKGYYSKKVIAFTLLVGLVILWLAISLDYDVLFQETFNINWGIFFFSTIIGIIALYFDGYVWNWLIKRIWKKKLEVNTVLNIHYASIGIGLALPTAGSSELATRAWLMKRQFNTSPEDTLSSMLIFRLFFYLTTFISTFLFFISLHYLNWLTIEEAIILIIFFYFIEILGFIIIALASYRLDLIYRVLSLVYRLIPLKFIQRANNFLLEKFENISKKFETSGREILDKRSMISFLTLIFLQYCTKQISIWTTYMVLIPDIPIPAIIVATTLTTFLLTIPVTIPGMQGIRELSNVIILAPFVVATTTTEALVLLGILQSLQVWIFVAVGLFIIVVMINFTRPYSKKESSYSTTDIEEKFKSKTPLESETS